MITEKEKAAIYDKIVKILKNAREEDHLHEAGDYEAKQWDSNDILEKIDNLLDY